MPGEAPEHRAPYERVRLFVALDLPGPVRAALEGWQELVLPSRQGLRSVGPESLHVTLCFLGGQPASEAGAILAACEAVAAHFPAPRLSLGRPVWLPRRRPRVLAVELEDPHDSLADLQTELSDRLSAAGWYEAERRRFLPHVTVARVRPSALPDPPSALPDPPRAEFTGPRVTLYRSHLGPGGARYGALGSVALGEPPARS